MAKRSLGKKVFSAARGLGRKSTQIARQLDSKAIDIGKSKSANYIVDIVGTAAAVLL